MTKDLPTEGEVIAELEALLASIERPIAPSEAYRKLADRFHLTTEQRTRLMAGSDEVHFENRVRQARRKLNNAGKLNRSVGRGLWALKKSPRS